MVRTVYRPLLVPYRYRDELGTPARTEPTKKPDLRKPTSDQAKDFKIPKYDTPHLMKGAMDHTVYPTASYRSKQRSREEEEEEWKKGGERAGRRRKGRKRKVPMRASEREDKNGKRDRININTPSFSKVLIDERE
ncbi:hypothetical protein BHE74_00034194 [Ensete ventricosum]|nr:hypothetical protein BHE74_00034194 [Ensete ventricosum]